MSPTARTGTDMGKTIAKVNLKTATEEAATAITKRASDEKAIDNDAKGNSSDSEYSSLEDNDDDNNQGKLYRVGHRACMLDVTHTISVKYTA